MFKPFTERKFPKFAVRIQGLADQHKEIKDEPLHLALSFDPGKKTKHIYLFEVVGNFGAGMISPDKEIFEISFGSTDSLPLDPGRELHLWLTSPEEIKVAMAENWPSIQPLKNAIRKKEFEVLYKDRKGAYILGKLRD